MRRLAWLLVSALAGCGSPSRAPVPQASQSDAAPVASPAAADLAAPVAPLTLAPLPQPAKEFAVLDSRDCRSVAQAYIDALARRDFAFAARVWDDPVIDDGRLATVLMGYQQPATAISGVEQEGAAGSSFCSVSGTLTDGA
jgi:hypothetical protein